MTNKEELLKQRELVDHKGRRVVVVRTGPNRAERRRKAAKAKKAARGKQRRTKAKAPVTKKKQRERRGDRG